MDQPRQRVLFRQPVRERLQRLADEHVPVPRRPEALLRPAQLLDEVIAMLLRQDRAEQREGGAQPADADAQLVDALGILAQARAILVRAQVLQALPRDHHETFPGAEVGVEIERRRLAGAGLGAGQQVVAARGLAAVLDGERHVLVQLQRQLVKPRRPARLQLQLRLADLLGAVHGGDLARVERQLDLRIPHHQRHGGPRDVGDECLAQVRLVRQAVAHGRVADLRQHGLVAVDRAFPFEVVVRRAVGAGIGRLEGLDALPADMAHAQRHAVLEEREILGIEIDIVKLARTRRGEAQGAQRGMPPQTAEFIRLHAELQFDLGVHTAPGKDEGDRNAARNVL
jgi:hypothetical protein